MGKQAVGAIYALVLIVVIVGVDLLFFRHRTMERLAVNIAIALLFAGAYFQFQRRS